MAQYGHDPDFVFLDQWYETSDGQRLSCSVHGGRFWEAQLAAPSLDELREFLRRAAATEEAISRVASKRGAQEVVFPKIHCGVCVPAECDDRQAALFALREFLGPMVLQACGVPKPSAPVLPQWQSVFHVVELSSWADLELDFVVAGVAGCGTTSMQRNLAAHPGIAFSHEDEDDFFHSNRLLPTRSTVEAFNAKRAVRLGQAKKRYGVYDSNLLGSPHGVHQTARVPNLLVILVLCDPLGRLEKIVHTRHYRGRAEDAANGTVTDPQGSPPDRIDRMSEMLARPDLIDRARIAADLTRMQYIFKERLLVVHQALLRLRPDLAYGSVATALGAGPYPPGARFHRYNSLRGHRTDLCLNVSLVRRLKARLVAEYEVVENAIRLSGAPPLEEVTKRRSRCEMPEELGELDARCHHKRRCSFD